MPDPGTIPEDPWPTNQDVVFDYDAGEYVIDRASFDDLRADPSRIQFDDTRLTQLDDGFYQVAAQGALSDALGWQEGDVLLSVNDYPLQGLEDFTVAYSEISHQTAFTVEIQRAQSSLMLRYRVE